MKPKLAFDLDGVLAHSTLKRSRYNMFEVYGTCIPLHLENLFMGTYSSYTIITGRKVRFRNVTEKWLSDNNYVYDGICYSEMGTRKTTDSLAVHKAKHIKRLNITLYIEDTPNIALKLIPQVPDCTVLLYHNNKIYSIVEEMNLDDLNK